MSLDVSWLQSIYWTLSSLWSVQCTLQIVAILHKFIIRFIHYLVRASAHHGKLLETFIWHIWNICDLARDARAVMYVGIANTLRRGKRSRHSRRMRNLQLYVSGKGAMQQWIKWRVMYISSSCFEDFLCLLQIYMWLRRFKNVYSIHEDVEYLNITCLQYAGGRLISMFP